MEGKAWPAGVQEGDDCVVEGVVNRCAAGAAGGPEQGAIAMLPGAIGLPQEIELLGKQALDRGCAGAIVQAAEEPQRSVVGRERLRPVAQPPLHQPHHPVEPCRDARVARQARITIEKAQ